MTDAKKSKLAAYASIAAAIASAAYGLFATADYVAGWLNKASVAIQKLEQVQKEIDQRTSEQRQELTEIKGDLKEIRKDVTRLLILNRPVEPISGPCKIAKASMMEP